MASAAGEVLICTHNALSPELAVAAKSIVARARLAGIVLANLMSRSSSTAPDFRGHANPFRSISPAPAGSLIVSGLQASPLCEKTVTPNALAVTLYVAP